MWIILIFSTAKIRSSGSRFRSRRVLLSGPKFQNTNCTHMFSTAVMRHKQQTSGRLGMANNTIVKRFFKFMPPGKCFISSIMSKFWWYAFHRQHKLPSSPEQIIFTLIFTVTIRQIFCLSPLLLMMSILSIVNTIWTLQLFFEITVT